MQTINRQQHSGLHKQCKFNSRQKNKQPTILNQVASAAGALRHLHRSKVVNECFISSGLTAGIGDSMRPILLILLHESGLSPLKTPGTAKFSADYKYAWKSILIWQRGEDVWGGTHRESGGQLRSAHSLHSFILLLSSFYFTCAYVQCLAQEICPDQQIHPFCTLLMSPWTTVVCNSKCDRIFVNLRLQWMYGMYGMYSAIDFYPGLLEKV